MHHSEQSQPLVVGALNIGRRTKGVFIGLVSFHRRKQKMGVTSFLAQRKDGEGVPQK